MSLLRRGDSIAIRRDSIATIRRRDPNMRGGVLSGLVVGSIGGAVFGALLGQALCEYDCDNEWVGGAAIGALFGAGVGVGAGYTAGMVFPRWRSVGANAVVVPPRASRFLPTDRCDGGDALFRVEGGVSTWGLSTARGELGVLCEPGTVAGFEGGFMDVFDVHTEQLVNDARGNYTREVDIVRTTKYIGVVADRSFSFLPPWMRVVTAVGAYRTTEESSSIDRDSSGQIIDPGSRSFVATNRDFAAGFGIGLSTQLVRKGPWAATAEARTHLFRGFTTSALTLGASYRPR